MTLKLTLAQGSVPISRRTLLTAGLGAGVVSVLAACSAPAPTAPTAAPAAAKPAAAATPPSAAAGAATQPAAAAPPPTAAAAAKPAAAAAGKPDLGALVGKLEGATIVTDSAAMPKTFKEAPMLADLVKTGKLPPVEQRVPQEPMVLNPLHEIGKYGGTMRRAFTGPADGENVNRVMATDKLLFVDYTGIKIVPSVAKDWKLEDGGKTTTLFLRKGMKWSDGGAVHR